MKTKLAISAKETEKLTDQLIGKKADVYHAAFARMDARGNHTSLNVGGLICSYFWAFYRGLYGWGLVAMISTFVGLYLILKGAQAGDWNAFNIGGNVLMLWPNLFFGFWGNHLYRQGLAQIIADGLQLPNSKQAKYFNEFQDGNIRVVLGLLFVTAFAAVAILLSISQGGNV